VLELIRATVLLFDLGRHPVEIAIGAIGRAFVDAVRPPLLDLTLVLRLMPKRFAKTVDAPVGGPAGGGAA
jgi:hypothetical protein